MAAQAPTEDWQARFTAVKEEALCPKCAKDDHPELAPGSLTLADTHETPAVTCTVCLRRTNAKGFHSIVLIAEAMKNARETADANTDSPTPSPSSLAAVMADELKNLAEKVASMTIEMETLRSTNDSLRQEIQSMQSNADISNVPNLRQEIRDLTAVMSNYHNAQKARETLIIESNADAERDTVGIDKKLSVLLAQSTDSDKKLHTLTQALQNLSEDFKALKEHTVVPQPPNASTQLDTLTDMVMTIRDGIGSSPEPAPVINMAEKLHSMHQAVDKLTSEVSKHNNPLQAQAIVRPQPPLHPSNRHPPARISAHINPPALHPTSYAAIARKNLPEQYILPQDYDEVMRQRVNRMRQFVAPLRAARISSSPSVAPSPLEPIYFTRVEHGPIGEFSREIRAALTGPECARAYPSSERTLSSCPWKKLWWHTPRR